MKRSSRFVAIVTALYVLQSPVCALACLERADASRETAVAGEMAGGMAGHACHESSPASSPEAPSSHEDCCESSTEAVSSQAGGPLDTFCHAIVSAAMRDGAVAPRDSRAASIPLATDLPPPDILLLNSTLII